MQGRPRFPILMAQEATVGDLRAQQPLRRVSKSKNLRAPVRYVDPTLQRRSLRVSAIDPSKMLAVLTSARATVLPRRRGSCIKMQADASVAIRLLISIPAQRVSRI
jgi:hypothetical protein